MNDELKKFLSFFKLQHDIEVEQLLLIINGQVQNPRKTIKKLNILIYKDKIIGKNTLLPLKIPSSVKVIDANKKIITPGLIDQHIHGGYGVDFNEATVDEMIEFSKKLAKHGITSIIPTVMTDKIDNLKSQIAKIKEAKYKKPDNTVKFLGVHLEGPFLCPQYKGIHTEENLINPSIDNFKKLNTDDIKIVTYSPELDKDFKLTKYLKKINILPSVGHSNASIETVRQAQKSGLKQVTHLFNAMNPLHHRTPGVIGEALTNDELYVEVIVDGLHLHPAIVDLILRAKPDSKVILVSDSLPLNNADSNEIIFGGQKIYNKDGKAVNKDGTFAGSLVFLDTVLKNLIEWKLSDLSGFLKFASLNVANNLGFDDLGYIDKDKTADIVIWNKEGNNYTVDTTIINGKIAYSKS